MYRLFIDVHIKFALYNYTDNVFSLAFFGDDTRGSWHKINKRNFK